MNISLLAKKVSIPIFFSTLLPKTLALTCFSNTYMVDYLVDILVSYLFPWSLACFLSFFLNQNRVSFLFFLNLTFFSCSKSCFLSFFLNLSFLLGPLMFSMQLVCLMKLSI